MEAECDVIVIGITTAMDTEGDQVGDVHRVSAAAVMLQKLEME